jgi:hypothetical protein
MHDIKRKFGIPDTLPPASLQDVWGRLWLGATGLLLVALSLLPHLVPYPWGGILFLSCWLALPLCGIARRFSQKPLPADERRRTTEVTLYTFFIVAFGVGFTVWARTLGLSWPVVLGALFFIESLPSMLVSFTEWWRLSNIGFSAGLMTCGFCLPFVHGSGIGVLLGASIFVGSIVSAAILTWQLRHHESCPS